MAHQLSPIPELCHKLSIAPLSQIADIIRKDWGVRMNFAAVPYVKAMLQITAIDSAYGAESGRDIVAYFLANASTWRGATAHAVKAELRYRLGQGPKPVCGEGAAK